MVSALCGSVWGRAQKRDNGCCLLVEFCLGRSCLLALTLCQTSFSPHVALVPFNLLPILSLLQTLSEGTPENPAVSYATPAPTVSATRSEGDLSSWCLKPGLVIWCGAGIPCSQNILPDFYPPHVGVRLSIPCLCFSSPPTCLSECDFFNSLVVRLPYSFIF